MGKKTVINVPILKSEIHYCNSTWQEMVKFLNDTYMPGYKTFEYGKEIELEYSNGTTGRVFVVFDNTGSDASYWFWSGETVGTDTGYIGWVSHECMHLVTEIMRQVETPLQAETEEMYAYLLEYIVTEVLSIDWKPNGDNND